VSDTRVEVAPLFRLDGQAAIVTGASAGLGPMIAHGLSSAGCSVLVSARRAANLDRLMGEIEAAGGRAVAVVADLRDPDHAEHLVASCVESFGRLDGVVLNAATTLSSLAVDEDVAAFADVLDVNVTAQMALAAAAARVMIPARRGGWMILQSSILARKAATGIGVAAYIASKGAVESLTRELARQWAADGIRVNALAPGVFPTEINAGPLKDDARREGLVARIPMGRMGEPADIAGVAVFLASEASRYITGQVLPLDGGMTVW
jgi:NAD(P)-dependent dehydrogenase (short-subunit alcohol dehydrogenase family)